LIANREFSGATWLAWLKNQRVPFVIRIRAHTIVQFGSFKDWADRLCSKLLVGERLVFSTACKLLGVGTSSRPDWRVVSCWWCLTGVPNHVSNGFHNLLKQAT
jgi:hypothetical protein